MTDAKRCDNCGKIGQYPLLGWFHIEPLVTAYGIGELDLCSWECMAVMAGQKDARERVARVQPPADELPEAANPF